MARGKEASATRGSRCEAPGERAGQGAQPADRGAVEELCRRLYANCSCASRESGPCVAMAELLQAAEGDIDRAARIECARIEAGRQGDRWRSAPIHLRG